MNEQGSPAQPESDSEHVSQPSGAAQAGEARSSLPNTGRLIAIDLGERRIGVAVSDPRQIVAQPLATLTRRSGKRFPMKQLRSYIQETGAVGFIIGLPLSPNGQELDAARMARQVGALIQDKTGMPVAFWDERMSTSRALSAIREMGGGTRGRRGEVDRLAATVLLQTFLDSRNE